VEADHRQLDFHLSEQDQVMRKFLILALLCATPALADALFLVAPALADAPVAVTLQNHKFAPSVIHVKANTPAVIALTNKDATAEEFDSTALKVEKVVAGNSSGNVRIRALAPGKYPFMGEYHAGTAQGVVIAE
jgi:hypothetical protein